MELKEVEEFKEEEIVGKIMDESEEIELSYEYVQNEGG